MTVPGGFYDPSRGERFIFPGAGNDPVLARMVSLHEAVHGFLDSSSSFGHVMKFTGHLLDAGHEAFRPLHERMKQAAFETHETYATVAAFCTATNGCLDRRHLEPYSTYLRYLESVASAFDGLPRPFLAMSALSSLARAAMQTEIDALLAGLPCADWPARALPLRQVPDARLYRLLRPEPCRRAMSAMDAILHELEPRLLQPGGDPAAERDTLRALGSDALERLNTAAFDVFADVLESSGEPRPHFNGHREHLPALVASLRDLAGAQFEVQLAGEDGPDADIDNVFMQFRHERLLLREIPDDAVFVAPSQVGAAAETEFILGNAGRLYVQFIAMPAPKARYLYRIIHGDALLDGPHDTVTGLRRRWPRAGMPPRIEVLVSEPPAIDAFLHARPDIEIFAILSHAAFADRAWREQWAASAIWDRCRLAVLIDTDPFALIESEARRGQVRITGFAAQLGATEGAVGFLCIDAGATPGVLYLTPCSTGLVDAVVEFVTRRVPAVARDRAVLQGWHDIMPLIAGHIAREERCFGADFW